MDFWSSFVFSDECRFKLRSDGRVWVWREKGQRYKPKNTVSMTNDRRSVHFWGAISHNGTFNISRLLREPSRKTIFNFWKLQVFKASGQWGLGSSTTMLLFTDRERSRRGKERTGQEWPAHSPDVNPIENVWAYIKRQLQCMKVGLEDLGRTIYEIWCQIPISYIRKLYQSMPNKVSQCCKNRDIP